MEAIKLRNEITELSNKIAANSKGMNDTSSWFMLPSEFKEKWNSLIGELLVEIFSDFLEKPKEFVYIIHLCISAVKLVTMKEIQCKVEQIVDLFGITNSHKNGFILKINQIMKDYWSYIFPHNVSFIENIKSTIIDMISKSDKININENNIKQMLDYDEFSKFSFLMYDLFIYMNFNENKLEWDLSAYEKFIFQFESYNKEKHYWVDGFPKQDLPVNLNIPIKYKIRNLFKY